MKNLAWLFCMLLAAQLFAESDLDLDDRVLDLEAQVHALKNQLEPLRTLAGQERPNAFNPSISVIGDILAQFGHGMRKKAHDHAEKNKPHTHDFQNGVFLRELEFELRGAIDPWADAVVALSVGQHGSHWHFHVEEAYARLKQWPGLNYAPLGIEMRAGIFKTAFGRMNRIHMHNLPQITYPMALQAFLGEEGYAAPGLSLNATYALGSKSALTLFLEGVMGKSAPMQGKSAEKVPNLVAHAWWHQKISEGHFLDIGASTLLGRYNEAGSGLFALLGADVHYSYLPSGYGLDPVFLFGSEFFMANKNSKNPWPLGNFTWMQARVFDSSFVGLRWDLAPQEEVARSFKHALAFYLSFYTSEFLRFRLGYEHVMPEFSSWAGEHRYMLSMNFVLGAHPAEPYFAHR